jgi:uncharacterized protein YcgI (DUF1989 family)
MTATLLKEKKMNKNIENVIYNEKIPAGVPWSHVVKKGQTLRIIDLEGCQAVDTLFTMPTTMKNVIQQMIQ